MPSTNPLPSENVKVLQLFGLFCWHLRTYYNNNTSIDCDFVTKKIYTMWLHSVREGTRIH